MPLSHSPNLLTAANIIATIFLAFGLLFTIQPHRAFSFFETSTPTTSSDQNLASIFITMYAVRDLFMAVAIYAAVWCEERRVLGVLLVAGGLVAFAAGVVVKGFLGKGEWNHWGYAPGLVGVGVGLLGVFD